MVLILAIVGALLAFGGGYLLARNPPDWRMDRSNERITNSMFARRTSWDETGMYGGWLGDIPRGISEMTSALASGQLGYSLCLLGAIICGVTLLMLYPRSAGDLEGLGALGDKRVWLLIGCFATGYVVGAVTDKGPVGPLE